MTTCSNREHRRRELGSKVFGLLANRALSRRTTGLDGVAERLVAERAGRVVDPELDHPEEWNRSID